MALKHTKFQKNMYIPTFSNPRHSKILPKLVLFVMKIYHLATLHLNCTYDFFAETMEKNWKKIETDFDS
jgi:hypothetical protein